MTRPIMYEAQVDLSRHHAGQTVEESARIRAEGHEYPGPRNAFGRPTVAWVADRWQAEHMTHDRGDNTTTTAASPWVASLDEAERWLIRERGLRIGGAYWHTAREVSR